MRKILLATLLALLPHISHAQVDDGIYVIPEINAYAVSLSYGDLVKIYVFNLEGTWARMEGSKHDGIIEVAHVSKHDITASTVTSGGLGAIVNDIYCRPYPDDNPNGCTDTPASSMQALPVMRADGELKAIFQTQWGADAVLFESNGLAVILMFEYGNTTADNTWIGAYTASMTENLAIFDVSTIVESASEDNILIDFELQVSNRINPQAQFTSFTCEMPGVSNSAEVCSQVQERFFTKLIRKF